MRLPGGAKIERVMRTPCDRKASTHADVAKCDRLVQMKLRHWLWTLWTVGTILIILSWMNVVSRSVGWIGFGIALLGTICSGYSTRETGLARPEVARHPASSTLDAIGKLAELRDQGAISESEFAEKKKALLDEVGGKRPQDPPPA